MKMIRSPGMKIFPLAAAPMTVQENVVEVKLMEPIIMTMMEMVMALQ